MKIEYKEIKVTTWEQIPKKGAFVGIWPMGTKRWYVNGRKHREDGPAVELSDGTKSWWLNDYEYPEQKYYRALFRLEKITEEDYFLHLL